MEEKMSGIVLGGISFGENDKILNVFTLEQGVVSAKMKGVKKAGAKLKFASEPFCFAEFIFSKKGEIRTVINASLIDSFYPVREDIVKYFCAGTVVEFIKRAFREDIVSPETFFAVIKTLENIAYGNGNPKSELVSFLVTALKESGYALNLNGCAKCSKDVGLRVFFDYRSGAFYCKDCFDGTGREISTLTYRALKLAESGNLTDDNEGTVKALKLLEYYLENRIDEKLNSLKELIKISN